MSRAATLHPSAYSLLSISIGRRLLHSALSLFAVSVLCFFLLRLAPGDYFSELRLDPTLSRRAIQAMEEQSDLRRPLLERYSSWCSAVLHGELGNSLAYRMPVAQLLKDRIGNTLWLGTSALLLAWITGLLLGAMTGWPSALVRLTSATLWSIPEPILALLILILAVRWHLLHPLSQIDVEDQSVFSHAQTLASHLALPSIALALGYLPLVVRHVQRGLAAARHSPAVEAAQAHGFSPWRIFLSYALPEAANPLLSLLGLGVGSILSASLFVEVLFGWPGMGQLLLNAILVRDTNVVVAGVLCSAILLLAGNFLADLLLALNDPRLRPGIGFNGPSSFLSLASEPASPGLPSPDQPNPAQPSPVQSQPSRSTMEQQ